nr:MAG TPA: hypothetical protein [Caudoviricetes sp.]
MHTEGYRYKCKTKADLWIMRRFQEKIRGMR